MDIVNNNPTETGLGSVPGTSTEATAAPSSTPAPAPVAAVKTEVPKTTQQTVGGWNRFAGYNPNAAKNKPKDGRGGPKGRR